MTPEHKAIKESLTTHWAKDPTNALLAKAANAIEALSAQVARLEQEAIDDRSDRLLARDAKAFHEMMKEDPDWDAMEAERDQLAATVQKLRTEALHGINALRATIQERDELRADNDRLKEQFSRASHDARVYGQYAERDFKRANDAEAENAKLREALRCVKDNLIRVHGEPFQSAVFSVTEVKLINDALTQPAATSRNMTAEEKAAHDAFFQQAQTTAGFDNAAVKAAGDAFHKSEKRRDA